jgi:hypothetical protein
MGWPRTGANECVRQPHKSMTGEPCVWRSKSKLLWLPFGQRTRHWARPCHVYSGGGVSWMGDGQQRGYTGA